MLGMNSYFLYKKYVRAKMPLYDYRHELLEHLLPQRPERRNLAQQQPTNHVPKKILQQGSKKSMHTGDVLFALKIKSERKLFFIVRLAQTCQHYVWNHVSLTFTKILKLMLMIILYFMLVYPTLNFVKFFA